MAPFWPSAEAGFRWYAVYGIRLRSRLELSFPPCAAGADYDVEVLTAPPDFFHDAAHSPRLKPTPSGWYKYAELDDGQSYLRWDGLFEFLVDSAGRRIWCGWLGAASLESLQVYLLGHALSFALIRQGYEPLHATAVVVEGRAVAFLGSSGSGKSSLAAAFLADGHRLLTDDLLLIRCMGAVCDAQPGPPRIKLFPAIARRFLGGSAAGVPMNELTKKLVLPLDTRQQSGGVPLRAVYVLSPPHSARREQKIALAPLSARQTFIELVRHTFNYLLTGPHRLQRQYQQCLQMAAGIPARSITYPRLLRALPAVRDTIIADLHSLQ
jgi:hypothetical protein